MHDFPRKVFLCYILLPDQVSLPGCPYVLRYWAVYIYIYIYIALVCCPVRGVIKFEINVRFLIKPFFAYLKVMTKVYISQEPKELLA